MKERPVDNSGPGPLNPRERVPDSRGGRVCRAVSQQAMRAALPAIVLDTHSRLMWKETPPQGQEGTLWHVLCEIQWDLGLLKYLPLVGIVDRFSYLLCFLLILGFGSHLIW